MTSNSFPLQRLRFLLSFQRKWQKDNCFLAPRFVTSASWHSQTGIPGTYITMDGYMTFRITIRNPYQEGQLCTSHLDEALQVQCTHLFLSPGPWFWECWKHQESISFGTTRRGKCAKMITRCRNIKIQDIARDSGGVHEVVAQQICQYNYR